MTNARSAINTATTNKVAATSAKAKLEKVGTETLSSSTRKKRSGDDETEPDTCTAFKAKITLVTTVLTYGDGAYDPTRGLAIATALAEVIKSEFTDFGTPCNTADGKSTVLTDIGAAEIAADTAISTETTTITRETANFNTAANNFNSLNSPIASAGGSKATPAVTLSPVVRRRRRQASSGVTGTVRFFQNPFISNSNSKYTLSIKGLDADTKYSVTLSLTKLGDMAKNGEIKSGTAPGFQLFERFTEKGTNDDFNIDGIPSASKTKLKGHYVQIRKTNSLGTILAVAKLA